MRDKRPKQRGTTCSKDAVHGNTIGRQIFGLHRIAALQCLHGFLQDTTHMQLVCAFTQVALHSAGLSQKHLAAVVAFGLAAACATNPLSAFAKHIFHLFAQACRSTKRALQRSSKACSVKQLVQV